MRRPRRALILARMDAETAAWVLKSERGSLGRHREAVETLRALGYVRIIHGAPVGGEWPILAIEDGTRPESPVTLYRRSTPEKRDGLFWCSKKLEAYLHTVDRRGLEMFSAEVDPGHLIAEFVMEDGRGRRSGGEFIVDLGSAA